jgi:non-lysosomal glucosylceramidase
MKYFAIAFLCLAGLQLSAQTAQWPLFREYKGQDIDHIAMPIGGIGAGNISIGGNGQWRDVEIMNKPAMGFYGSTNPQRAPCFLIFTEQPDGRKMSKALIGPVPAFEYSGGKQGSDAPSHGLPRFASASFNAAYPFGRVQLDDPEMPVSAKAKVFNPFIPGDADASGLPIAVIRYEITNKTDQPLTIAVAGSLDNFIGMDGFKVELSNFDRSMNPVGTNHNRNSYRNSPALAGIYMTSDSVDKGASTWGTIALTTTDVNSDYQISFRKEFDPKGWNANITDMWDDFSDDGQFKDTSFSSRPSDPRAALSVKLQLKPREVREIQFLLTWHFPNRTDWEDKKTVGNYYTTLYKDAWDAAEKIVPQLPSLEAKTADFVSTFLKSDYPAILKEAALFNTSTLRSQTAFRTADGNFFGWEGVFANTGSCFGNCTHVWNYEYTTPFLFGALATKMRQVEYNHGLWDSIGLMSFRVSLPLGKNNSWKEAAADGQMGTIQKVYREWQMSGDDAFLKEVWPGVKRALAFAWIPGGWDANKDGVMEGCQHNTMDIEYFGPNPEVEFWYLGALKAAAAMAHYLKDKDFEKTCTGLFEQGSRLTDEWLFNGNYYIQKIQPIADREKIAPGLLIGMGSKNLSKPDFQIGEGCLVDQLVGQNMALANGLGYLAKPANVRKALESVAKFNYVRSFGNNFNNMRSYAMGNEGGLILTAYPDASKRPAIPLSYAFEAWAGLEYTAATGMIYEGMNDEALKTIASVRQRYDGSKRNPFNEEECGNHYARSMAAWSAVVAWSQFNFSAVNKKFSITGKPGNYFWSNGYSWGNAEVGDHRVVITVHQGQLDLKTVELKGVGTVQLKKPNVIGENKPATFTIN